MLNTSGKVRVPLDTSFLYLLWRQSCYKTSSLQRKLRNVTALERRVLSSAEKDSLQTNWLCLEYSCWHLG